MATDAESFWKRKSESARKPLLLCTRCGYVGKAERAYPGSDMVGLFLLLLLIVPGLIYFVWQHFSAFEQCSRCESRELIPQDSPKAKEILAGFTATEAGGVSSELERLAKLKEQGILNEDEFRQQKQKILDAQ